MIVFITFGAGKQNYVDAGKRLIQQAKSTGYFDKTILFTERDLKTDKEFWNKHSTFISKNRRGYGYWIWKSYIIKKTMETMKKGDILCYLDAGCEIGGSKQLLIPSFLDAVKTDKIIGSKTCIERDWCKMDLLLHFNMQDSKFIDTAQRQSGALIIYTCPKTKFIMDLWYDTSCNYHFIDDSKSNAKNLQCFKEHRHDQSILSLILKKYNMISKKSMRNCIHIVRNRTGSSRLK